MLKTYENKYLIAYPYMPPLSEELEWATDVKNSYNGTESRHSLRCLPVCTITARYDVPKEELPRIMALLDATVGEETVWCPLWHLGYEFETDVAADRMNPVVNVTDLLWHGFQRSTTTPYHCVINASRYGYDIDGYTYTTSIAVTPALGDNINVTGTMPGRGGKHSIASLVEANLVGARDISGEVGTGETLEVQYRLVDPLPKSDFPALDSEGGYDTFFMPTLNDYPYRMDEAERVVWYKVGGTSIIRSRKHATVDASHTWRGDWDEPASNINEFVPSFRRFIWTREGRTRPFLRNSFRKDIQGFTISATSHLLFATPISEEIAYHINNVCSWVVLVRRDETKEIGYTYRALQIRRVASSRLIIESVDGQVVNRDAGWLWAELALHMRLDNDTITFTWEEHRQVQCELGLQSFIVGDTVSATTGHSACS